MGWVNVSARHGKDEPGLVERLRAQLAQVTAERDRLQRHLEAREELDQLFMSGTLPSAQAADGTGPFQAVQPRPHRAAHRTPKEQRWLKSVPAIIPAGAVAAAIKPLAHAVRASWAAHPVATAATGVAAFTAATVAAVSPVSPVSPFAASTSRMPAPAASIYSATPIPVVSPSMLPAAAFMTRPKTSVVSSLPFIPVPPPVPSSSVSPGPVPAQQDPGRQPAPPAAAGMLSVGTATADLSSAQAATVTISADGGPVRWSAWCGSRDVSIGDASGAEHGTVYPGSPVDLTVSLGPVQDGRLAAACHVWPGGFRVSVILPAPPPPPADPAGTSADTPSPLPT